MDSKKSNKIREIVRLQQILKKWRKLAANTSKTSTTINTNTTNNNGSKSIKFLAVSVGDEQKRYTIPTEYLSHQAFHILLREAEEEFGFQQAGVLRIPCTVTVFENILKMVENKDSLFMQECRFSIDDSLGYCSSDSQRTPSHHTQSPMCR